MLTDKEYEELKVAAHERMAELDEEVDESIDNETVFESMDPEQLSLFYNMYEYNLNKVKNLPTTPLSDYLIKDLEMSMKKVEEIALRKIAQRMIDDGRIKIDVPSITH